MYRCAGPCTRDGATVQQLREESRRLQRIPGHGAMASPMQPDAPLAVGAAPRSMEMSCANSLSILSMIALAVAAGPARAGTEESEPTSLRVEQTFADSSQRRAVISRIELQDGQTLYGRIVEQDEKNVTLEMPVGGRIVIERNLIKSIRLETNARVTPSVQVWMPNPNRDRYLLIPSGMMLRQGEFYFSQTQLLVSTITVGLADNLTLVVGGVLPAWFVRDGFNFVGGLKAGFSITEL